LLELQKLGVTRFEGLGRPVAKLYTRRAVGEAVQTNLELARHGYALWNASGMAALVEHVFAPDVVFYDIPEAPDTGIFRGVKEVAARLREITESLGGMHLEVRSLEEQGDYVLAAVDVSVKGPSSGVVPAVSQFHVLRWVDGRLLEYHAYLDADQARREYEQLSS
jgi:ketosteroid isomerase-like protein